MTDDDLPACLAVLTEPDGSDPIGRHDEEGGGVQGTPVTNDGRGGPEGAR